MFLKQLAIFSLSTLVFSCKTRDYNSTGMPDVQTLGTEGSISYIDGKTTGDRLGLKAGEIALTLDDGPVSESIDIARYLSDMGIPITYYMIGQNIRDNPNTAMQIAKLPNTIIANHSWSHKRQFNSVPCIACDGADYAISEVMDTDKILQPLFQANNTKFFFFRAPGGNFFRAGNGGEEADLAQLNKVAAKYVGPVRWDVDGDVNPVNESGCGGDELGPQECADVYMRQVRSLRNHGIVILAHDIHANSRRMVKLLVDQAKSEGFKFVAQDKYPDFVAAVGKIKPTKPPQTEFGNITFTPTNKGNGTYEFMVKIPTAARIEIWVDGKNDGPLLKSMGDLFKMTYKFNTMGKRFLTIKGFDAKEKLIAQSMRNITLTNDVPAPTPTPAATPSPSPSAPETACVLTVTSSDGANLREVPSGAIIQLVAINEKVKKIAVEGAWTKVDYNGKVGFLFSALLSNICEK